MTPLEWIGLFNLVILPVATWALKQWRGDVKNTRIRDLADMAVRAAEEMSANSELDEKSKHDFVVDLLTSNYPQLKGNEELLNTLIQSAVHAAGMGASSK